MIEHPLLLKMGIGQSLIGSEFRSAEKTRYRRRKQLPATRKSFYVNTEAPYIRGTCSYFFYKTLLSGLKVYMTSQPRTSSSSPLSERQISKEHGDR